MPDMSQISIVSGTTARDSNSEISFDTHTTKCVQTRTRQQAVDTDAYMDKPAIARANIAATADKPDGSPEYSRMLKDYVCFPPVTPPHSPSPIRPTLCLPTLVH